ncbi:MAG: serine/threonine-protein kinase, partial [Gemmatimonadales bacterium]
MADVRAQLGDALTGRYAFLRELGRGGMATVFLATDLKHDRPVAFKVLHPDLAQSLGAERFQREIRMAARLQHPHVLTVHDSGESAGYLWFTMPFVEGETLRARLTRERQLSLDDALRIGRQAAQALQYAHDHGVIHRDIKPENLLLTKDGNTLVADFGIARALGVGEEGAGEQLTQTGMSVGTPAYMSPEQAAGDRALDARTDVYSLGSVIFEMLSGEQPYTGPTMQAVLMKRLTEPVPSIRRVRPTVPEAVDQAVMKSLASVPADRFATAAGLAAALDQALLAAASGATVAVAPEHSAALRTGVPKSRRRLAIALGSAAVVVAAALAAWRVVHRPASVPLVRDHLAVMPFAVHGGKSLEFLAQGLVDLLSRNLDGAGGIRSVNGATVLVAARSEDGGVADLEQGRRLARRVGAQLFVLGNVSAIGNQIRIDASLYDGAPAQPALLSQASASGDTTQLFDLVDRLAGDLMVRQLRGASSRLLQTASVTTRSLPALKAYLDAERQLRHGNFDSAFVGFQGAVQLDSTFALAYYRLAVASAWANRGGLIRRNTLRAVALGDRLGERDRRLLASFAALAAGKPDEAEREYREILQDYPDDFEAQWQLATLLDTYNPFRGRPIAEAGPAFENIVKLDPEFLCLTCAMMHLAVYQGDVPKAESLVVRVGRDYADSVMFAVAAGDKAAVARLLAEANGDAGPGEVISAVWQVQQWLYRPADAEPFARALAARPSVAVRGNLLLAENLVAQGRWTAADSALVAAERDPTGGFSRVARGLMAALPFLAVPRAELERVRADVAAWDPAKDSDLQGPAGALV